MKGLFPEYDDLAPDFKEVWKNALCVVDTNVLLNLYRYQANTRDQLLSVLEKLSERIWIPHHVALEFQRNRLTVVAEQNKRFSDVQSTINKAQSSLSSELLKLLRKQHSLIDPEPLISGFAELADDFLKKLTELQEKQQKLSEPDPLKQKIEDLFEGHVGPEPSNQATIDLLYKEGETRFKFKIPPGYEDAGKDRDEPDEYAHGGITYKRKYGDFLVWMQLLDYCKSANVKSIIFVTDDRKGDWWRIIESDGPKTIGPRPELIDEGRRKADVETLVMYNTARFLRYAKEFLEAQVSEETLREVRDLAVVELPYDSNFQEFGDVTVRAIDAVKRWIEVRFNIIKWSWLSTTELYAMHEGKMVAFKIMMPLFISANDRIIHDALFSTMHDIWQGHFSEAVMIFIVPNLHEGQELRLSVARMMLSMPHVLRVIIGIMEFTDGSRLEFCACHEFFGGEPFDHFRHELDSLGPWR